MEFNWLNYPTDKITGHGYQNIFNKFLNREAKTIVEFGCRIGSARMWCDYFLKGNVYGCDIVPFIHDEDRFNFLNFDMNNPKEYDRLPNDIDVIIEDGPHTSKSQQIMLEVCINKMSSGGVIIFEDLHCTEIGESQNYNNFVGDASITLNNLLREWKNGIFNDYKYIKGSKFKNKKLNISLLRGETRRWQTQSQPSEVIVIEVL